MNFIRHTGVTQLLFLIDNMCISEDQRTNTINTHITKEIGLRLQILSTISHPIVSTVGRTNVFNQEIDKHVLLITVIKSKEVRFSIPFLPMLHRRLPMQDKFCCVNLVTMNMNNEPHMLTGTAKSLKVSSAACLYSRYFLSFLICN